MEKILKIIYDTSIRNKISTLNEIEKIIEILIDEKSLNDYISNINVQFVRSNNLASYSNYNKIITIYCSTIDKMLKNIEHNILNLTDLEKYIYKNLSIVQVLLHEVEHANQEKISFEENNMEAFLLRISNLVDSKYLEKIYEYNPQERLAEIKSYVQIEDIIKMAKITPLLKIINIEKSKRLISGYHYSNNKISFPSVTFFEKGKKQYLLSSFEWYKSNSNILIPFEYSFHDRLRYGFPISEVEYSEQMINLVSSINNNYKDKILLISKK